MLDNFGSNVTSYNYGRLSGPVRCKLKNNTQIQGNLNPNINFRPAVKRLFLIFPFYRGGTYRPQYL